MKAKKQSITGRYALSQGSYWAVRCALSAFSALYLQEKGVSPSATGIFLAVVSVMPALIMPYLAERADRPSGHSLKFYFYAVSAFLLLSLITLLAAKPAGNALFAVYFAALVTVCLPEPFLNAMSGSYERAGYHVDFGMSRGIGSLSFAIASYVLGAVVRLKGVDIIPGFALLFLLLCAAAVMILPTLPRAGIRRGTAPSGSRSAAHPSVSAAEHASEAVPSAPAAEHAPEAISSVSTAEHASEVVPSAPAGTSLPEFLRKYPRYTVLMTGFFFIAVFHLMTETYIFNMMEYLGGDSGSAGTALLIANVAEFAVVFNFEKIRRWLPGRKWLVLTAALFAVKAALFHLAPNIPFMYAAQALQAVTFGFYAPSVVHFAEEEVAETDAVKGQSVFMSAFLLGGSLGNLLGGLVIGHFGVHAMTGCSLAFACCGAVIASLSLRMQARK